MKDFFRVLCLIFIVTGCLNRSTDPVSLIDYVPGNPTIIIKVTDVSLLKSEILNNDFFNAIKGTSWYEKLLEFLTEATAYLNPESDVLFYITEIGKRNFECSLLTKNYKGLFTNDMLNEKKVDTLSYNGMDIRKISVSDMMVYTAVVQGVFMASSSQLLVENMIRQKNTENPNPDEIRDKLYKTFDTKSAATIFIHNNNSKTIWNTFLNDSVARYIGDFSDWIAIELSIDPEVLSFTGIAMADPSAVKTVGLFDKTIPQKSYTPVFTSVNASGFVSFTFDHYGQFHSNLMAYRNGKVSKIHTAQKDTVFTAIREIGIITEGENTVVLMRSSAIEDTKEQFTKEAMPVSIFREMAIYQHLDDRVLYSELFPLLPDVSMPFYAFIDDFMIFSTTIASLQQSMTNYMNRATLAYRESFTRFISGLNDKASLVMVGLQPEFKRVLQGAFLQLYEKDIAGIDFKDYPYFAFQINADHDFVHLAAVIEKAAKKNKEIAVTQQSTIVLDTDMAILPQFVTNHSTKQQEIVVQDVDHMLYRIAPTGKLLWKKKLDSKIQGKVHPVDLYRNGRLQVAFVTRNKLHVIDRKGNEVAPFPIHFTTAISQPLAVFDYDKNGIYRFLVCQGNRLSMYDGRGEIVNGFTFTQTQSPVLFAPKHFRVAGKDYLVVLETNGKLHILHRTGKQRIAVPDRIDFSNNPAFLYNDKFTVTDKKGRQIQIDTRGVLTRTALHLEGNHHVVIANKIAVTLSDHILTIKDKSIALDFGLYTRPDIFYSNGAYYVTVTDMQTRKVYLYDANGNVLPHFPVYGMSSAVFEDVDNDGTLEFMVKDKKNTLLIYHMD